jgi:hypothetical protein
MNQKESGDRSPYNGYENRLPPKSKMQLIEAEHMRNLGEQLETKNSASGPFFEVLTAGELAKRWRVPESWVREQTRARCTDPIPHIRLGRYVRFCWGSPQLSDWWRRRQFGAGTH